MSNASYKKRARAGYCCSSKTFKERIYKERQAAKKEIAQAELEMIQGDEFRYKAGGHNKNKIAVLQHRLRRSERRAIDAKERGDTCRWFGWYGAEEDCKRIRKQLEELGVKVENNDEV